MLQAVNISKRYPGRNGRKTVENALSGISVAVEDASTTVIVGESGSGKSTLARILSFIERPDEGRVFLDETELTNCDARTLHRLRGRVQLVMQDAAGSLDPYQSVEGILAEPLRLLLHMRGSERDKRISELLEILGLPELIRRRRVSELSGGQQKRLCIARALAAEPEHILLDEAFSGLDVTVKKQTLDLLKKLRSELQLSLLIITHDIDTAMYMADRIYVMHEARIVEQVDRPQRLSDFQEAYSQELVNAARYKREALQ